MVRSYRVIYLDAFTDTPYAGNPCAVLPDARGLNTAQMQRIAREANLPETAFVLPSDQADFRVRYFTPTHELPFAGHPTIATTFMLAQEGMIQLSEPTTRIHLEFGVGVLPVDIQVADGGPSWVVMTQRVPDFGETLTAEEVAACFSLSADDLLEGYAPQVVSTGVPFLLVPARNIEVLKKADMQRDTLRALCARVGAANAYMFCPGGFERDADLHARFFGPDNANEDPYTGSAGGCAGAYGVHHGLLAGPEITLEQGHIIDRPGIGVLRIEGGPGNVTGVQLGGAAVKVLDGHFFVDEEG